ncbi:MAG TPA: hypothetical protein QF630_05690 [Alphaproteobacteria bacterium]|nr:hypothetical protein [Alphaproteobacteria bacterium]
MFRRASAALSALALGAALAACAGPDVDRTVSGFDYKAYYTDLNNCRGGSAFEAALETTGIGLWGGLVGAYYGLHLGFSANEGAEGMLVGAIIGAGAGIGVGAYESVSEFNDGVSECLRVKGYTVS